jgi:hypothetical protein
MQEQVPFGALRADSWFRSPWQSSLEMTARIGCPVNPAQVRSGCGVLPIQAGGWAPRIE